MFRATLVTSLVTLMLLFILNPLVPISAKPRLKTFISYNSSMMEEFSSLALLRGCGASTMHSSFGILTLSWTTPKANNKLLSCYYNIVMQRWEYFKVARNSFSDNQIHRQGRWRDSIGMISKSIILNTLHHTYLYMAYMLLVDVEICHEAHGMSVLSVLLSYDFALREVPSMKSPNNIKHAWKAASMLKYPWNTVSKGVRWIDDTENWTPSSVDEEKG